MTYPGNDQPPARAMAGGMGGGVLTDNPPAKRAYKTEGLTS